MVSLIEIPTLVWWVAKAALRLALLAQGIRRDWLAMSEPGGLPKAALRLALLAQGMERQVSRMEAAGTVSRF